MSYANITFAVICWFCSLIFIGIAVWAFKRKSPMHFWSGTTVKPEEIANIPAYNRANGLMWSIYGGCMILTGVFSLFSVAIGAILLGTISIPGLPALIICYKKIYKKYKNNSEVYEIKTSHSVSKMSKWVIVAVITFSVIVLFFVGAMIYIGSKDPAVNILDNGIEINAMYGVDIEYSEIVEISLIEKNMQEIGIGIRTNGYGGIGEALKGNFKSEKNGETLLFVQSKSSPTIKIERYNKKDVYISFVNSDETKQLYQKMLSVTGSQAQF